MNRNLVKNHEAPSWIQLLLLLSLITMGIYLIYSWSKIDLYALWLFGAILIKNILSDALHFYDEDKKVMCNAVEILKGEMN